VNIFIGLILFISANPSIWEAAGLHHWN